MKTLVALIDLLQCHLKIIRQKPVFYSNESIYLAASKNGMMTLVMTVINVYTTYVA